MGVALGDDNCNVGLTIHGVGTFDGDWIASGFVNSQAVEFQRAKDEVGLHSNERHPNLAHGCFMCDEADKKRVSHTWAVRSMNPDGRYQLIAICTKGCPDSESWPLNWTTQSEWTITSNNKTASVSASCCKRKSQPCDTCDENSCEAHHTFLSCLGASTLGGCCTAAEFPDEGVCICQAEPIECDHSGKFGMVV